MDTEEFNTALQSKFITNEFREILLQVVGNASEEIKKNIVDDEVRRAVTINQGVTYNVAVKVTETVVLASYHTFLKLSNQKVNSFS